MIRKEALREAIKIVQNAEIDEHTKDEIISGLELCIQELPFSHWSRAAIFDACDQWVQEHGELHLNHLQSAELPSHPAIKNRFGMTAKEFRDKYYPISNVTTRSRYYKNNVEEWDRLFKEEFHRLKATSSADYNKRRDKSLPSWITLARMHKLKTWSALLNELGLPPYTQQRKVRPAVNVRLIQDTAIQE